LQLTSNPHKPTGCIKENDHCLALYDENIAEINKYFLQKELVSLTVSLLQKPDILPSSEKNVGGYWLRVGRVA
jgi:hypothetical protein